MDKKDKLCGFYRGGMKQEELNVSEAASVIFGTFSMISEGFDVATLDTLVLSTPKSDIVQTAGRILRKEEKDRERYPLIIDLVDVDISLMANRLKARMRYYKKTKFEIQDYTISEEEKAKQLERKNKKGGKSVKSIVTETESEVLEESLEEDRKIAAVCLINDEDD